MKDILKTVIDKDYSGFRKEYLKKMQDDYDSKKDVVRSYIFKRISLGKETGI